MSLGNRDVADGGRVEHAERAGNGRALEVILGVKSDGVL
jgi:hypothetical protein